jgi:hypothetical protein
MSKFLIGVAVAALAVPIAPAFAQPGPAPSAPQVQIMRSERGTMRVQNRDDVVRHVRKLFARLDGNRDGFISRDEADSGRQAMGGGDRRKDFAERLAQRDGPMPDRGAAFERLDTNRDGMISRQEFMAAQPRIQRSIVMRETPGGQAAGPAKMHMKGMGGLHGRLFDMADSNRDGLVSLQEATGAALRHFDMADANHDGQLTPDERTQMHQRIRVERHPA